MPWNPSLPGATAQSDNQGTTRPGIGAVSSAARTASGNSVALYAGTTANTVNVALFVTAVSGTTPSMTISIDWSNDGTTWFQSETPDTMTAVTATGNKVKPFVVKAQYFRIVWAITGTTPSFTFSVDTTFQDD